MHEQQSPELSTHSHPLLVAFADVVVAVVVVAVVAVVVDGVVVVVVVVRDALRDEEQLPLPQDIHDR